MAVSPNDKLVATGSQDKTAKLWNTENCVLLGVFSGHKRGIWCVQFSPVDQVLATSSADGTVKIWDLQDFSCLKVLWTKNLAAFINAFPSSREIQIALDQGGWNNLQEVRNCFSERSWNLSIIGASKKKILCRKKILKIIEG